MSWVHLCPLAFARSFRSMDRSSRGPSYSCRLYTGQHSFSLKNQPYLKSPNIKGFGQSKLKAKKENTHPLIMENKRNSKRMSRNHQLSSQHVHASHTHIYEIKIQTEKSDIPGNCYHSYIQRLLRSLLMKQLLEAVRGFEDLGNLTIQLADDLVYGLLPGRINIFASNNGIEKLP